MAQEARKRVNIRIEVDRDTYDLWRLAKAVLGARTNEELLKKLLAIAGFGRWPGIRPP